MELNNKYEELKDRIKEYYLQDKLIRYYVIFGQDREVVPVIKARHYVKRPSVVMYDTDYKLHILDGATSFHTSVEKWKQVLKLKEVGEDKEKTKEIRKGWDIIIDIDSKATMEESKITAKTIVDFLEDMFNISPIYVKFSGSRGFHLGIKGESLPEEIEDTPISYLYPDLLHKISIYIKEKIEPTLRKLLGVNDISRVVEIETNWSYRHLFRMPYSINEKTYFISEVISPEEIIDFQKEEAILQPLEKLLPFLEKKSKGDLEGLCYEAIEYYENSNYKKELTKELLSDIKLKKEGILQKEEEVMSEINNIKKEFATRTGKNIFDLKIEKEFFPNTIKNILNGLSDGKKRAIFILLNFLRKMNWSWEEIEREIEEWNKRNPEPLKESYIRTQMNYFKKNEKKIQSILPPNFETKGYYDDMGILDRTDLEMGVKNPVSYAYKRKLLYLKNESKYKKYENNNYRNSRNRKNIRCK